MEKKNRENTDRSEMKRGEFITNSLSNKTLRGNYEQMCHK